MQKTPSKNLQDLFKTYVAKSGDEEKFRKAHVTTTVDINDEKLGPKEDQFVATTKVYPRDATHHGYDIGGDEKVYAEEAEQIDEISKELAISYFHKKQDKAREKFLKYGRATNKKGVFLAKDKIEGRAKVPATDKKMDEEAQQIDEVSHETRKSWVHQTWKKHLRHVDDEPGVEKPEMPEARKKIFQTAMRKVDKQSMQDYEDRQRAKRAARKPQVHDLRHMSHGEVYDHTQTSDKIQDGDIMRVKGGTAVMLGAWPTMVHGSSDVLHGFKPGTKLKNIEGGSYQRSALLADKTHALKEEVETIEEAMNAKDRYVHHHDTAKALLKSIGEHLSTEKKEALSHRNYKGQVGPHWGHVGTMEHIAKQLGEIHDQLARQGEYAATDKIAEGVEDIQELSQKMVRAYRDKATDDKDDAVDDREFYKAHNDSTASEDDRIRKRTAGIKMASKKIYGGAKVGVKEESELEEKHLTPAEMKKREEIAKAMERENPGMDKSKKMAIATAQAKKVAEEIELGESVMSDDAFDRLEKAGAKDCKTTTGGINYTAGGKEYKLRHDMKRSGHRTVRSAELKQHLDRLNAMNESVEEDDALYLKEGTFKNKMLAKGINSLTNMLSEDSDNDE